MISDYYDIGNGNAAFNAVLDVSFSGQEDIPPITRETVKTWLRLDSVQDNILVDDLTKEAIDICEGYLNQSIINRTVTATLNNSCGNIYLPYGPVKEVSAVTNVNGTDLFTGSNYTISGTRFKRLTWPQESDIKIVYTAGYGDCIPPKIKAGIKAQIAWMYEHRGDEDSKAQLSPTAKGILRSIRMV